MRVFETPEAPFSIFVPSGWKDYKDEHWKSGGRVDLLIVPWLWQFSKEPDVSAVNIDSKKLPKEAVFSSEQETGEFLKKILAWDFKRFTVPVKTKTEDRYWIADCEFFQGKKEKRFYKLRLIINEDKKAYLTFNYFIDQKDEQKLYKELQEVNKIFDSFHFV